MLCPPTVGSFSLLRFRRDFSALKCCGFVLHRHSRLLCVRNRVRLLEFLSCPPQLFRVLLLRRLWLPLPLSSRTCRCGRPLDVLGHHRAACSRAGVLAIAASLSKALLQGCAEAGARVSTNLFVRDLDLPVARHDGRRLEVVADGFPLFNGGQFAIDTTLVSLVLQTVSPGVSVLNWTALLSPKPVVSSSALIESSRVITAAPGWL